MKKSNMKNLIFLLIILSFSSCGEKESNKYCGVEDPRNNLPWLKNKIDSAIIQKDTFEVYKTTFEDSSIGVGFSITQYSKKYQGGSKTLAYDCVGNYICENISGITGFICVGVTTITTIKDGDLIYKSY